MDAEKQEDKDKEINRRRLMRISVDILDLQTERLGCDFGEPEDGNV